MAPFEFVIHELLFESQRVGPSMRKLIDAHAKRMPAGDWSPYYDLPYDAEAAELQTEWFPAVIAAEPPARVPIAGLWFGLFQTSQFVDSQRQNAAEFYVAGARQFELDRNGDWAVDPAYFPEGRYARSRVLAEIYRLAYETPSGLGNDAEDYLGLGYVALAVKQILATADVSRILASAEPVGVAVGWDSGSYPMYVGFVTRGGFQVRDPNEAIAGIKRYGEAFEKWFAEKYGKSS